MISELRMGYAQADCTPGTPVQMIGFGRRDETSRGVAEPLMAQVSVWAQGDTVCCLTAIDHIGFAAEHADRLRQAVGDAIGAPATAVMLCFSHTHAGPNDSIESAWSAWVDGLVVDAAVRAKKAMQPVRIGWGCGRASIGVNRRKGGTVDNRAGILRVEAMDGSMRLLVLRLTAHANALKGDNYLLSPDWIGAARERVGQRFGCSVMITQGACGNVAPRFFCSRLTPPDADDPAVYTRSDSALQAMADEVTQAVAAAMPQIRMEDEPMLSMTQVNLDLPSTLRSMDQTKAIAADARQYAGMDGTAWLAEVKRLHDAGITVQQERLPLQCFRIGNGCLCGVRNELMCELAQAAVSRTGWQNLYLGGYTNGCTGYLPTAEEYDRGGYEVLWSWLGFFQYHGHCFPLDRDSGDRLLDALTAWAKEQPR